MVQKVDKSWSKILGVFWSINCSAFAYVTAFGNLDLATVEVAYKFLWLGVGVSVALVVPKTAAQAFIEIKKEVK